MKDQHSSPLTLDMVAPGMTVVIKSLRVSDNPLFRRLMSMGLVAGQALTVLRPAPLGDPIAVSVLGYTLSLRLSEARILEVVPT